MSEPSSIGLTAERLREVLTYDPDSGEFQRQGKRVGTIDSHGYCLIRIDWKLYRACRLAWLYMTGEWPAHQVDHRNTLRADDRWENLRAATNSQNNMNRAARKDNKVGIKGVFWIKKERRWIAQIAVNGRKRRLGAFADPIKAGDAYASAAAELHQEFARVA